MDCRTTGELESKYVVCGRRRGDDLCADQDLCPQPHGLGVDAVGESCPADPLREPRVVLDPRAGTRLSTRGYGFDHEGAQSFRGGVQR
jgi:hypothetical protein